MNVKNPTTFQVGDQVTRLAHEKDYTNGRTGQILYVNEPAGRAQVIWSKEKTGHAIRVKSWIKFEHLRIDNG